MNGRDPSERRSGSRNGGELELNAVSSACWCQAACGAEDLTTPAGHASLEDIYQARGGIALSTEIEPWIGDRVPDHRVTADRGVVQEHRQVHRGPVGYPDP